jgi:aminocarboxymuconate-semialdehyde decarboxylase
MIDCHSHFIAPAVLEYLRQESAGQIRLLEDAELFRFQFPRLPASPPAPRCISEIQAAETWQRDRGIALQIFGPWTDLFGYTLDERAADYWTHILNEGLAAGIDGHPSARGLGSIAIQHPSLAAKQVADVVDLGFVGVMIGTAAPDMGLDARALDLVWEALVRYEMPAFIHPIFLLADPALQIYGLANAVGRSNATTTALSRVLLGGVLERHPALKLVVAHGGGAIPSLLGRLQRAHELSPTDTSDPTEGFGRLYFDSAVSDPRVLRLLIEIATPRRVLLGSDWPFPWTPDPGACVRAADLATATSREITVDSARRVFRLGPEGEL